MSAKEIAESTSNTRTAQETEDMAKRLAEHVGLDWFDMSHTQHATYRKAVSLGITAPEDDIR